MDNVPFLISNWRQLRHKLNTEYIMEDSSWSPMSVSYFISQLIFTGDQLYNVTLVPCFTKKRISHINTFIHSCFRFPSCLGHKQDLFIPDNFFTTVSPGITELHLGFQCVSTQLHNRFYKNMSLKVQSPPRVYIFPCNPAPSPTTITFPSPIHVVHMPETILDFSFQVHRRKFLIEANPYQLYIMVSM